MYTFVNRAHTPHPLWGRTHFTPLGGAQTYPFRGIFVFMSWDYCFSHCFSRKNSRIQYPIIRIRKIPPAITTAIFQTPRREWWTRVSMGIDQNTRFPRRTFENNPWWTAVWNRVEPQSLVTPSGLTFLSNTSRRISLLVAGPQTVR